MKIKTLFVCFGLLGISLTGACSKSMSASPTAPGAVVGTSTFAAPANISGRVGTNAGLGFSTMSATAGTVAGITVSVTGTPATSVVDQTGHFQLAVPPGPVDLHFTGSGVDSHADLGAVAKDEKVDVLVNLTGSNADLEVTDRTNAGIRKIEGKVSAVPPTTAVGTFRIGDRLINTNAATEFYLNGRNATAGDLTVGSQARVTSMAGTDAILALEVNTVNDQAPGGNTGNGGNNNGGNTGSGGNNNGSGSGAGNNGGGSGGGSNNGSGSGGGNNGGGSNGGGSGGGSDQPTTVTGPVSGILGVCPGLNLHIGGTVVNTNANTQFELSCLGLLTAKGNATATGTKNTDGSITATIIK